MYKVGDIVKLTQKVCENAWKFKDIYPLIRYEIVSIHKGEYQVKIVYHPDPIRIGYIFMMLNHRIELDPEWKYPSIEDFI